ncbi:MAG: hypothetical protein ACFE94_14840 [Candidatus Hodarchaeota archaeon]
MKDEEKIKSPETDSQLTLFRFELNRSQASLLLVLALMGIFMLPFNLAGDIFLNLFQLIFSILPSYLENPEVYHEDYLFYHFTPIIISIILSSIFLTLSIYGLRRILKNTTIPKRKIISQNRIVHWFGLNLSHGQAIFIFSASIPGILFIVQLLININSYPGIGFGLLESLCWIPDGPNRATSHGILLDNVPMAILITFLIICLYSLIITRRGKKITSTKKITTNDGLLIFIGSFAVFILLSARIFCHLALFNYDVSHLLGISYNAPNPYQNNDFIKTLVFFCICIAFMITSFFLKVRDHKEKEISDEFSWFRIKITPHRAIILLSSALIFTIFFTQFYLTFIFLFGGRFTFDNFFENLFHIILLPIIIFCYYPIGKILKNNRFDKVIVHIDNSREFNTNWFKFRLDKTQSIVLLSANSVLVVLYIFQLIQMNMAAQAFYTDLHPLDSYLLFSFPLMTIIIFIAIVVNIYTVIKTLPSIKSLK